MMYCKLCKKKVSSIAHWAKKHKAYLQKKRRNAPKKPKKSGKIKGHTEQEHAKTSTFKNRYCPSCGYKF